MTHIRHFCTYFDHNYLPRGMVMLESLREQCPQAHVHVLCLSEECYSALSRLAYPHVSLMRLEELEAADPELAATRTTRSLVEYYFTFTPCLPWWLLTQNEHINEITYLDADLMFFSSPEPLFVEAGDAAVILTPHRFSPHLADLARYGLNNVSWITFRKTRAGLDCLGWYRASCLEWCGDRLEEDRFADQKYLDLFPQRFADVHVLRHNGAGVAPWNLAATSLTKSDKTVMANDQPLIFYHAHAFKHVWGPFYASGLSSYNTHLKSAAIQYILKPYSMYYTQSKRKVVTMLPISKFTGIRSEKKSTLRSTCRQLLTEWKKKTLLVC